jgi:hypothetical protein
MWLAVKGGKLLAADLLCGKSDDVSWMRIAWERGEILDIEESLVWCDD